MTKSISSLLNISTNLPIIFNLVYTSISPLSKTAISISLSFLLVSLAKDPKI